MRSLRWILPHHPDGKRPALYHCITRVVERRFAFGPDEKEQLRTYMRMQEKFTGNRVLAYCFMSNHLHLLLEITPPKCPLSDNELLERLSAIYSEAQVNNIASELREARKNIASSTADQSLVDRIHGRFTYRMHNLSEFMKGFLQRYTQWHNAKFERSGHLWEDRFKSLIVEGGSASKAVAAYIDLNPVRAGIVKNPADYRWCSYGEAISGKSKANINTARAGLVRAIRAHSGTSADPSFWHNDVSIEYKKLISSALNEPAGNPQIHRQNPTSSEEPKKRRSPSIRKNLIDENTWVSNDFNIITLLQSRSKQLTTGSIIKSEDILRSALQSNNASIVS